MWIAIIFGLKKRQLVKTAVIKQLCYFRRHIIRKVDVLPPKRIQHLREGEFLRGSEVRGLGPCDGFSTQYACMCDFHTMPYREEVAWVNTLCCRLIITS